MEKLKVAAAMCITLMQRVSLVVFAMLAACLTGVTLLAMLGLMPWVTLPLEWNGAVLPGAGVYAQVGLTLFAISLCFFLPANGRMVRLETSHRRFELDVNDITRAYHSAHAADREGLFGTADAFDNMRERIGYMRAHPDFEQLEPEILELAAKMSYISRDLADAYSAERVDRARSFLKERQHEIDRFNERLAHAKAIHSEFSNWIHRMELDENVARTQMERLVDELETMLPELNSPANLPAVTGPAKVTRLQTRAE